MRTRRLVLGMLAILLGILLSLLVAGSLWLQAWIPTHGKARLEAELRQRLHLDVSIGAMRYVPWRDLLLENTTMIDPATSETWLHAPMLRARLEWLTLFTQRQVALRLGGRITAPCQTDLAIVGRYEPFSRELTVEFVAAEISIDRLGAALSRRLPPSLKSGTIQPTWQIRAQPGRPLRWTGRLIGAGLVWAQDALRATGAATVLLEGLRTAEGPQPWTVTLSATITQGSVVGLPVIGSADHITGTIHYANGAVEIETLRGQAWQSAWQLEGRIAPLNPPSIDVLLRTRVELAAVAAQMAGALDAWQPTGAADLAAVCRGPLARWPQLELMAEATVREASLTVPRWPHPLQEIAGRVRYDHLSHRLEIESLAGQTAHYPVALRGSLIIGTPLAMDLSLDTQADLTLLQELLPADGPLRTVTGAVTANVQLGGTFAQPTWDGQTTLTNAELTLRTPAVRIQQLTGAIHWTRQEISSSQLACTIAGEPVAVVGSIIDLSHAPRIFAKAQLAGGSINIDSVLRNDRLDLNHLEIVRGHSRLSASGTVSRLPETASQLALNGAIASSDLQDLPWVDLKAIEAWQWDGTAAFQARMLGRLDDWRAAKLSGVVSSDRFSLRGIPWQTVRIEVAQDQGTLAIRAINATVAGGRMTGELLLEHQTPPRYRAEFDVMRADLAQLADAIPSWKNKQIRGTLSARGNILGRWNDRASLQGQGWFHAEGEHLGELPLLSRVFRGLLGALADRLGLSTLRTAQLTELGGQLTLAQERLRTDDLRLAGFSGTEPITIYVRGSVGLDKTLDCTVEPELSERAVLQAPTTASLSTTILKVVGGVERFRRLIGRHHLGGTIDNPQYKFEVSLEQLLNQTIPFGLNQLLEPLQESR